MRPNNASLGFRALSEHIAANRPRALPDGPLSIMANLPKGFTWNHPMAGLHSSHVPTAGDDSPKELLAQLAAGIEDFKAGHKADVKSMQRAVDDLSVQIAALQAGGSASPIDTTGGLSPDPDYSRLFASTMRGHRTDDELKQAQMHGERQQIMAAMSVSPDDAGGYLAPVEWDRQVRKAQLAVSPFRQITSVISTQRAYSTVWNKDGWGSGWVGEAASRPATTTPELASLVFPDGEIYAMPSVTQRLLDDAAFPLEQWLAEELSQEFDRQEGVAFISGDGVNKPRGFLTYATGAVNAAVHPGGALVVVPTGTATTLGDPDKLIDFVYSLPAPYRQNARWMINSTTAATIAKMKDGDGNYLWRETYIAGQPATLLGYPVTIDEGMSTVGAGNLPIAFGDFRRGYIINDRIGVRILRDPFTNKPFVSFYATKRVGGGVLDPKAIRVLKVAAS